MEHLGLTMISVPPNPSSSPIRHTQTQRRAVKVRVSDYLHGNRTTMVVTPLDGSVSRARTLKTMRAAAMGIPIVSSAWIRTCINSGSVQMPHSAMYGRTLLSKTPKLAETAVTLGVARQAAHLQHQVQDQTDSDARALAGTAVCLCGPFESPPKADTLVLLRESGAVQLKSVSAAVNLLKGSTSRQGPSPRSLVLLCDDWATNDTIPLALEDAIKSSTTMDSHLKVSVVKPSWLFDSITCGRTLPPDLYEPFSDKAKELWAMTMKTSKE